MNNIIDKQRGQISNPNIIAYWASVEGEKEKRHEQQYHYRWTDSSPTNLSIPSLSREFIGGSDFPIFEQRTFLLVTAQYGNLRKYL